MTQLELALEAGISARHLSFAMLGLAEGVEIDPELLERQSIATGDGQLAALIEEAAGYPVPAPTLAFGMFASFDTPFEVTTSELAVELLFPADRKTAGRLHDPRPAASNG